MNTQLNKKSCNVRDCEVNTSKGEREIFFLLTFVFTGTSPCLTEVPTVDPSLWKKELWTFLLNYVFIRET